jgi:hypothetical protein
MIRVAFGCWLCGPSVGIFCDGVAHLMEHPGLSVAMVHAQSQHNCKPRSFTPPPTFHPSHAQSWSQKCTSMIQLAANAALHSNSQGAPAAGHADLDPCLGGHHQA